MIHYKLETPIQTSPFSFGSSEPTDTVLPSKLTESVTAKGGIVEEKQVHFEEISASPTTT